VVLPTPEAVLTRAQELDRVFRTDPTRLRQKLLRFFEDGEVLLHPQTDGTYVATSVLLPLVVLAETGGPAVRELRDPSLSSDGCAGARCTLDHDVAAEAPDLRRPVPNAHGLRRRRSWRDGPIG
jgi:hypothetical protein